MLESRIKSRTRDADLQNTVVAHPKNDQGPQKPHWPCHNDPRYEECHLDPVVLGLKRQILDEIPTF